MGYPVSVCVCVCVLYKGLCGAVRIGILAIVGAGDNLCISVVVASRKLWCLTDLVLRI